MTATENFTQALQKVTISIRTPNADLSEVVTTNYHYEGDMTEIANILASLPEGASDAERLAALDAAAEKENSNIVKGEIEVPGDSGVRKGAYTSEEHHANGALKSVTSYHDEELHGPSKYYDEDGNLTRFMVHTNGVFVEEGTDPKELEKAVERHNRSVAMDKIQNAFSGSTISYG